MKKILSIVVLSIFTQSAFASIYWDMGDDWIKEMESSEEIIEGEYVGYGNGACYAGNPFKIAHEYFKAGSTFNSRSQGKVTIEKVYVANKQIRVSYNTQQDGKSRLAISACSREVLDQI